MPHSLPPLFCLQTILDACLQDQLVLTPNQRLASKAMDAWDHYQQSQGLRVWQPARIYSLEQWLTNCWQELQGQSFSDSLQIIASPLQQTILWQQITAGSGLMQSEVLAQQAADAYTKMQLWQLPLSELNTSIPQQNANNDDLSDIGIDLYPWCLAFEKRLSDQDLITREHSINIIGTACQLGELKKETVIHLLGFNDVPPLIDSLLHLASEQIDIVDLKDFQPQSLQRLHLQDTATEMASAAQWAKSILSQEPMSRVAIVVPNLAQSRGKIERALIESFEGHSLLAETPRYTLPFNISAGIPLSDTPLIADTLLMLNLFKSQWPMEDLCHLLYSPFWGELNNEQELRTQTTQRLLEQESFDLPLSELHYFAEKLANKLPENLDTDAFQNSLFGYLSAAQIVVGNNQTPQLPSKWVEVFLELLNALNWPGERQPDSHEYQQSRQWYLLLEQFAALDDTLGKISAFTAIQQLKGVGLLQTFQAEVPDSPIQVLGLLEAAGLQFTHCWIMGLDHQSWPAAPKPNPLLPLSLQRQHAMPHANHLRELSFAQSLTEQFRHCAKNIIFSSPSYNPDTEQALTASALIADIALCELDKIDSISDFNRYQDLLQQSQQLESIDCRQGPCVSADEYNPQGELGGGAAVLKAQAGNPFDAFAIHRLNARRPQQPTLGFSAIDQGNILHHALASIWQQLQNQAKLLASSVTELEQLVVEATRDAVLQMQRRNQNQIGPTLCNIEIERQSSLILSWLAFEKTRPTFTVVAIEESCQLQLAATKLKLRIDRVDQLDDGSFLIIDYKSGQSSINSWQGERPAEPQLPLYLLAYRQPVTGIAFAQINVDKQSLVGLEDGKHSIPGITAIEKNKSKLADNWQQARAMWQQTLEYLLQQFLEGNCLIDYRDSMSFNRAHELWALNRYYDKDRLV